MEREQTKMVIRKLNSLYPNYFKLEDPKFLIDTWHDILEDYEYEEVVANLKKHIKTSSYPPKVSDLVTKREERIQNIPGVEETKKLLKSNMVENPVTEERMNEIMLEKLGKEWVERFEQHKRNK